MPALVHKGSFQMVKEVTYGTNPATGYTASAITNETLKAIQMYEFVKSIHGSRAGSNIKVPMGIDAGGGVTLPVDVEGLLPMLVKGILPSETTTDEGSGNGGMHAFVEGEAIPSFSCLVNRDTTPSANNVWAYTGCTVDKLTLSAAYGQLLTAVATMSAQNGVQAATPSAPSYTTQNPLVFHTGTITVGGTPFNISSFSLDIESGNLVKRGKIGSKLIQQQQPGLMKVTGSLTAYFDNMTLLNDFINGTDASIELNLTGTAVGTSTRGCDILLPVTQFTGTPPTLDDAAKEIELKMPFTAWLSGAGSPNNLIQITITNSQRTAY